MTVGGFHSILAVYLMDVFSFTSGRLPYVWCSHVFGVLVGDIVGIGVGSYGGLLVGYPQLFCIWLVMVFRRRLVRLPNFDVPAHLVFCLETDQVLELVLMAGCQ